VFSPPSNAFVDKINAAGTGFDYRIFLPGSRGKAIDADAAGNAYVITGPTIFKLNPTATALIFTRTLAREANDIATDAGGSPYVTAHAVNADNTVDVTALPTIKGLFPRGGSGAYLMKLDAATGDFLFSTTLATTPNNQLDSFNHQFDNVAVDPQGNAVVGTTLMKVSPLGGDNSAPVISNVQAFNITTVGATIHWNTDSTADGVVEYGPTSAYGSVASAGRFDTTHDRTLFALRADSDYHFRVSSMRSTGNVAFSADIVFHTAAFPVVGVNPQPSIVSLDPNKASTGSANLTVRIRGSNFMSGATVRAGSAILASTFVDTGTIDAVIPSSMMASAGTLSITVTNPDPGGGTSAAATFQVSQASAAVLPPLPIAYVETGSVQTGYIVVSPDSGSVAPSTTVTYGMVSNGVVLSQGGVLAASLVTDATLFVDNLASASRNLGVAIANTNSWSGAVHLDLIGEDGMVRYSTDVGLLPNEQIARFIDEIFNNDAIRVAFKGSLRLRPNFPMYLLGFRFIGLQFSTVPVSAVTAAPVQNSNVVPPQLLFPQFALGGGWATEIALVNNTDQTISGEVAIHGKNGALVFVLLNGQEKSTFRYSLAPRSTLNLAPRDTNGQSPF
jgi:hypothetical protein